MSSSRPTQVDHRDVRQLGGRGVRSPQLRVLERVSENKTRPAFEPRAGLPPGGRAECEVGPRPCPFVRCRQHLWLIVAEERQGRRWSSRAPPTTLLPAWLETPMPPSCALDVAAAIAAGADDRVARIAALMHLGETRTYFYLKRAMAKLRALGVELEELTSG